MNKDFPRFVFTSPGPKECQGGTYGDEIVKDENELSAALDVGFFESIPEALEALKAPKEPKAPKERK